jgi:hypothetical protein
MIYYYELLSFEKLTEILLAELQNVKTEIIADVMSKSISVFNDKVYNFDATYNLWVEVDLCTGNSKLLGTIKCLQDDFLQTSLMHLNKEHRTHYDAISADNSAEFARMAGGKYQKNLEKYIAILEVKYTCFVYIAIAFCAIKIIYYLI